MQLLQRVLFRATGWWLGDDCCPPILHRLRLWRDAGAHAIAAPQLHPRQQSPWHEVAQLLVPERQQLLTQELLCARTHRATTREGGHCQIRQVQMAAALLKVLRGVQICWAKSTKERRHHRCELDRRVLGGRRGASPAWAVLPRDHGCLQQQVCGSYRLFKFVFHSFYCKIMLHSKTYVHSYVVSI